MEGPVGKTVSERDVDGIAEAISDAAILELAGSGEVRTVLVETARHDTTGTVEGLFDSVPVVAVDVDVEYSREDTK